MREGAAYVFAKHANLVIAGPGATARDVAQLAVRMAAAGEGKIRFQAGTGSALLGDVAERVEARRCGMKRRAGVGWHWRWGWAATAFRGGRGLLVQGNTAFPWSCMRNCGGGGKSLFLALQLSSALAMTYAGARANTAAK
jgi:hypothetical protein